MNYKETTFDAVEQYVQEYAKSLSSPVDSFLEGHILGSKFYSLSIQDEPAGYFAILDNTLLTQFFIEKRHIRHSQSIFQDIAANFNIKETFVPTCDELFMSLCLDVCSSYEKQAYFFQDAGSCITEDSLYRNGVYRVAEREDIPDIRKWTGDFFDNLELNVAQKDIFVWYEGEVLIGAGIIEKGVILKDCASIGMITNENYRQKGIGRSILTHLKRWCFENGYRPIAGCWYYNHLSKKTLESAGFITNTRLIRFKLDSQVQES
jgi:GNAT superfamily N-acetyltransferase